MINLDWNYAQFGAQIKDLILVTGRDLGDVVKQQTRLFLKDAVAMTPPMGAQPLKESSSAQRKMGENAVKRDIRRAFIPIEEMQVIKAPKDPKLAKQIEEYARREDYEALGNLFQKVGIRNPVAAFPTSKLHNAARDSRGRVKKGTKQTIVVRPGSVDDFIKENQKLVGEAKSGWALACDAMGVRLPSWIKRHRGPGIFESKIGGSSSSITVGDSVNYIQSSGARLQIIRRALDRRTESMKHQIEKIIGQTFSGYKGRKHISEPVSIE